jgi:hypothetical protein
MIADEYYGRDQTYCLAPKEQVPKKMGNNLSGKRTIIGRVSGESHVPPKELNSQVKGQRKDRRTSIFPPVFFLLGEIAQTKKGGLCY